MPFGGVPPRSRSPPCAHVATCPIHKINVVLGTLVGCMHLLELRDLRGRYSPPTSVAVGLCCVCCTPKPNYWAQIATLLVGVGVR